jgi:3'-5' exoribonuclease
MANDTPPSSSELIRIAPLRPGQQVSGILAVKIRKAVAKYAKGYRLDLVLTDATGGSVAFTLWGPNDVIPVNALLDSIGEDGAVKVTGIVGMYNEELQITANSLDSVRALSDDECPVDAFIPPAKRDITEMREELREYIQSVSDVECRKVLDSIFTEEFTGGFAVHPAAVQHHHNRRGGLIEHTLEVAKMCEAMCGIHKELNRDLIITGALVHDIGKIREITVARRIKADPTAQLVGHLMYTSLMLAEKMEKAKTPEPLRSKILHMALSHHGLQDYGAPKEPMFPEAAALHYADAMSALVAEMIDFSEESRKATLDDTMYCRKLRRNVYLK